VLQGTSPLLLLVLQGSGAAGHTATAPAGVAGHNGAAGHTATAHVGAAGHTAIAPVGAAGHIATAPVELHGTLPPTAHAGAGAAHTNFIAANAAATTVDKENTVGCSMAAKAAKIQAATAALIANADGVAGCNPATGSCCC
jgi:hypothetical protein